MYRRLNKGTAPPNAETQARIRLFINERQRHLLRMPGMDQLRADVLAFDSVASQQQYAVPEQGIARIERIWDTTNRFALQQRTKGWLRATDANPPEGLSLYWIPVSYAQVHSQPGTGVEVFVKSTSASDVNRCYVEGITEDGDRKKAEVTMTGVTAVSLDTTITTWIRIDKFYLSEAAVGTVTLHETSGAGDELGEIGIGDTSAKYLSFLLYPTPSAVITYTMDVQVGVNDMVNQLDEPLLPTDFHDLLAIGARLDEYEHTDDSRRRLAEIEWDEGVKALKNFIQNPPEYRPRMGGTTRRPTVGGWNPADVIST